MGAFDEKQFFGWFDLHGTNSGPDGKLDLQEFSWYIADVACDFDSPAETVVPVLEVFECVVTEIRAGSQLKAARPSLPIAAHRQLFFPTGRLQVPCLDLDNGVN